MLWRFGWIFHDSLTNVRRIRRLSEIDAIAKVKESIPAFKGLCVSGIVVCRAFVHSRKPPSQYSRVSRRLGAISKWQTAFFTGWSTTILS